MPSISLDWLGCTPSSPCIHLCLTDAHIPARLRGLRYRICVSWPLSTGTSTSFILTPPFPLRCARPMTKHKRGGWIARLVAESNYIWLPVISPNLPTKPWRNWRCTVPQVRDMQSRRSDAVTICRRVIRPYTRTICAYWGTSYFFTVRYSFPSSPTVLGVPRTVAMIILPAFGKTSGASRVVCGVPCTQRTSPFGVVYLVSMSRH